MTDKIRLAHISDPHFTKITLSPSQFLNKRWLGNLNQILFRHYQYQTTHIQDFPELFKRLQVDFVMLTGDLSSLSLDAEFLMAKQFVEKFAQYSLPIFHLPGNHDAYIKKVEISRRYYDFLPNNELKENRIQLTPLRHGWWWLALDCAYANGIIDSNGTFPQELELEIHHLLKKIPSKDSVIVGNHFPLFGSGRPTHDLRRSKELGSILKTYPQVKLYLHGHDHTPYIVNRQQEHYPLVCNAGSCSKCNGGTFYLIDLYKNYCHLKRFRFSETLTSPPWVIDFEQDFPWIRKPLS